MISGVSDEDGMKIVQRLLTLTEKEKLEWQAGPSNDEDDGLFCLTSRWKYEVVSRDRDGVGPYELNVYGPKDPDGTYPYQFDVRPNDYDLVLALDGLFQGALSFVRGVNGVFEDVLADLDQVEEDPS